VPQKDRKKYFLLNVNFLIKKSKELSKDHYLNNNRPVFKDLKNYQKLWSVQIKDLTTDKTDTIYTPYVCVCSGMFLI
jgi:hypothetical protein